MKLSSRWIPVAAGALFALSAGPTAFTPTAGAKKPAKSAKKSKRLDKLRLAYLDSTLDGLEFGADEASALKWARLRLQHHYDPRLAKAKGVEKQRWTEQIEKELEAIKNGVYEYKGGKSKVATSIVGKDFGRVPGERLMIVRVGSTKHYLLFDTHKKLWRYARTVPTTKSFKERTAQYTRRVGPTVVELATPKAFAGWRFKKLRVELRDERVMFGGDALVISHRKLAKAMSKKAKALGKGDDNRDATAGLEDVLDKDADKRAEEAAKAAERELEEHMRKQREAAKKRGKGKK